MTETSNDFLKRNYFKNSVTSGKKCIYYGDWQDKSNLNNKIVIFAESKEFCYFKNI